MRGNEGMKKKKFQWQQYILLGFFALLGAVCGMLMVDYAEKTAREGATLGEELLTLGLLFVGMYVSIFLQTIIHEGGHLIFGLKTGYQFSSFRVGSLMLTKQNGQLLLRRLRVPGTGGQCLMAPPDLVEGKMPYVLYNLGGSIMNLIACLVFFIILLLVPEGSFWARQLLILILVGGVLALMNGIPLDLGMVDNDGRNALSLGRDPRALRAFWIQMKANELIAAGVRMKDMPEEWFQIPWDKTLKNSMMAAIAVFSCNRLMDQHRFAEAKERIETLLGMKTGVAGLHRNLLICDLAYCEMIELNRRDVVEELLTKPQRKFMKSMGTFPTVMRTEYVYALLVERNGSEAEQIRREFEKRARSYPYPADMQSERELMDIACRRAMGEMHVQD